MLPYADILFLRNGVSSKFKQDAARLNLDKTPTFMELHSAGLPGHVSAFSDNPYMENLDWDDPAVDARWCGERRQAVTEYLAKEALAHGEVGTWPAWHVAPYVSIWAIESLAAPGYVGWWVISGDLPSDYLSAAAIKHPRKALLAFSETWKEVADCLQKGLPHPHISIGPSEQDPELASLVEKRSDALRQLAEDDSVWGAEYD